VLLEMMEHAPFLLLALGTVFHAMPNRVRHSLTYGTGNLLLRIIPPALACQPLANPTFLRIAFRELARTFACPAVR